MALSCLSHCYLNKDLKDTVVNRTFHSINEADTLKLLKKK